MAHSARRFFQIELRCVFFVLAAVSALGSNLRAADVLVPSQYSTIQAALAVADLGDTIRVSSGTYTGPVVISQSVGLVGVDGASTTFINAPPEFATFPVPTAGYDHALSGFITERAIVYIEPGLNVLIRGFTVDGMRYGPSISLGVAYSGILVDGSTATITNNVIHGMLPSLADSTSSTWDPNTSIPSTKRINGRGIDVRGGSSVAVISGNTLQQINRFHILVNATDDLGNLPSVFPNAVVENNTIIGKGQYGGGQKGIWFNNGAWGKALSNTVSGLDYTDPTIEPDRASGIVIWKGTLNASQSNLISFNNISASTANNNKGIYDWGLKDTIADNAVSGFRFGIELHEGQDASVWRNTVSGGTMGILVNQEDGGTPTYSTTIGGSPENKNIITGQSTGYAISLSFRILPFGDSFFGTVPVNATYNDFGVYTFAEVAARIFDRSDTTSLPNATDTVLFAPFYTPKLRASVKVFLQGPYVTAGDSMSTALKTGGSLAAHFGAIPIPGLAVDSINIELRDSASAAKAKIRKFAPAWLLANGTVRNFADTAKSYVEFDTSIAAPYYLVARHRNHLAIMDTLPQNIDGSTSPAVYDFSTAQNKAYGTNPMVQMGTKFALIAGDANLSAIVSASDANAVFGALSSTGYDNSDVNLSAIVSSADANMVFGNLSKASQVP